MQVYVINLEKDVDKLASVNRQMKSLGCKYERIPGVYGRELSSVEVKSAVSLFRWWCAIGRAVSLAEVGCALSHFAIYKKMVSESLESVCILEDDVILDKAHFMKCLGECQQFLTKTDKAAVLLLSDHDGRYANRNEVGDVEIVESSRGMCTDGYCLNLKAARYLLDHNLPIIVPCDTWGRWVRLGGLWLGHVLPTCCRQAQETFGTSTAANRRRVEDLPLLFWVLHKMKRVIGKSFDLLLQVLTRR